MLDNLIANWPMLGAVLAILGFTNRDALSKLPALLGNLRGTSLVIDSRDVRVDAFNELLAIKSRLESLGWTPEKLACFDEVAKDILAYKPNGVA